jgi:hypothetical protein
VCDGRLCVCQEGLAFPCAVQKGGGIIGGAERPRPWVCTHGLFDHVQPLVASTRVNVLVRPGRPLVTGASKWNGRLCVHQEEFPFPCAVQKGWGITGGVERPRPWCMSSLLFS